MSEVEVYSNAFYDAYVVGKKSNRVFAIEKDRCKGCTICVNVCPYDALYMSDKKTKSGYFYPIENGKCVACRECLYACPDFVLSIHKLDDVTLDESQDSKEEKK